MAVHTSKTLLRFIAADFFTFLTIQPLVSHTIITGTIVTAIACFKTWLHTLTIIINSTHTIVIQFALIAIERVRIIYTNILTLVTNKTSRVTINTLFTIINVIYTNITAIVTRVCHTL